MAGSTTNTTKFRGFSLWARAGVCARGNWGILSCLSCWLVSIGKVEGFLCFPQIIGRLRFVVFVVSGAGWYKINDYLDMVLVFQPPIGGRCRHA